MRDGKNLTRFPTRSPGKFLPFPVGASGAGARARGALGAEDESAAADRLHPRRRHALRRHRRVPADHDGPRRM